MSESYFAVGVGRGGGSEAGGVAVEERVERAAVETLVEPPGGGMDVEPVVPADGGAIAHEGADHGHQLRAVVAAVAIGVEVAVASEVLGGSEQAIAQLVAVEEQGLADGRVEVHGLVVPDTVAHVVVETGRSARPPPAPERPGLAGLDAVAGDPAPLVVAVGVFLTDVGQDRILHVGAVDIHVPIRCAHPGLEGGRGVDGPVEGSGADVDVGVQLSLHGEPHIRLDYEQAVFQVLLFRGTVQKPVIPAGLRSGGPAVAGEIPGGDVLPDHWLPRAVG